jgi:Transposase
MARSRRGEPGGDRHEGSKALARVGGAEAARGRQAGGRGRWVADVCRHLEVSTQTYQRWRAQSKAQEASHTDASRFTAHSC